MLGRRGGGGQLQQGCNRTDDVPPALSQQVAALELETGQRLLNRNGRGAEPTDAGLALLAHARGHALKVVAEVDSIKTVLSLVERGVAATVLPVSAIREWTHDKPPFTAKIYASLVRNRLCVAVPKARPATRLSRFLVQLTRDLCLKHDGDTARLQKTA
jgi:DNA-binding transcriptional LysR family regulator